jgi:two-component sensor histidine kinase
VRFKATQDAAIIRAAFNAESAAAEPLRRGFGSRLIERGLAGELAGNARLDFRPDGLVCTIKARFPFESEGIQP